MWQKEEHVTETENQYTERDGVNVNQIDLVIINLKSDSDNNSADDECFLKPPLYRVCI